MILFEDHGTVKYYWVTKEEFRDEKIGGHCNVYQHTASRAGLTPPPGHMQSYVTIYLTSNSGEINPDATYTTEYLKYYKLGKYAKQGKEDLDDEAKKARGKEKEKKSGCGICCLCRCIGKILCCCLNNV